MLLLKGLNAMKDTFAKIEIMLLRKTQRRLVENGVLVLLVAMLALILYWRFR